MIEEYIVKQIIKTAYLTLKQYGYNEISLKQKDLLEYVSKVEEVLNKKGVLDTDLFVKTPVLETYDEYKTFLINIFIGEKIGYINDKYDTIIINCTDFYIYKNQKQMVEYKDIINELCSAIVENKQVVDCANCDNEHLEESFMCTECNESYQYSYKKFIK